MAEFIPVSKDGAEIFLKSCDIQRISFTKSETLAQSQRIAKVVFTDGSTGEYVAHRDVVKAFWAMAPKAE